jgi:hypothetical protein
MSLEDLGDRLDDSVWHKVQTDRPEAPVNGWRFDPSRQVWRARTGENQWTEVKGTLDNPPSWRPGI